MLGDELHNRYCTEQDNWFVNGLYEQNEIFFQAPRNDSSILSAYAMVHGMFRPGYNLQEIDSKFLYNAIPPIEDFNFSKWTNDLGIFASYGGATVFPVQMVEKDKDFELSLDDINCASRAKTRGLYKKDIDKITERIRKRRPAIEEYIMQEANGDWEDFCDNIMWIFRENHLLRPDIAHIDLDEFNTVCLAMKR